MSKNIRAIVSKISATAISKTELEAIFKKYPEFTKLSIVEDGLDYAVSFDYDGKTHNLRFRKK